MTLPRTFIGFSSTDIGYYRLMIARFRRKLLQPGLAVGVFERNACEMLPFMVIVSN